MTSGATPGKILDELSGYSDGPPAVVDAFVTQRTRFLRYVIGLDETVWSTASHPVLGVGRPRRGASCP